MPTTETTAVTVHIPTPLRKYTDGEATVEITGDTVDTVLHTLVDAYPELEENLLNEEGALRQFVNLYVNDEDIRYGDGVETTLNPGDELSIVPSIAGG